MKRFFNRLFMPPGLIGGEIGFLIAEKAIAFKADTPSGTGDQDVMNLLHAPLLFAFWIHPCTQHDHSNTKLKIHCLGELIHASGQCFPSVPVIILEPLSW